MKLYLTNSTNPYFNLAAEEYYLRNSEDDVFMLWQNEPSVIIGKNQNMYAEVNFEFTESKGIHVARRITGGGAVYHDLGNVNYSFITSREKANVLDFAYFTAPVLKALEGLGINAKLSGRNDLIYEDEEGKIAKFSGSAQTATKTRVLHHGTLLFDSEMSVLAGALKPDEDKLKSKAIKSVRSRVMNLRELVPQMTTPEFIEYLITFAEKEWNVKRETVDELEIYATGLPDRNASDDYNAGRREEYAYRAKTKFPGGTVVVLWNTMTGTDDAAKYGEIIHSVRIEGDFFGDKDTKELEEALIGEKRSADGVREALEAYDVSEYIMGATNEEFAAMFSNH